MFINPQASLLKLPRIFDERGNLSFIEANRHIPFEMKRVYWLYDVPGGEKRGGHAYKTTHECIIALSGSFDIKVNNGDEWTTYSLNRSYLGLYLPPMHFRMLDNFSTNSFCLVLSSNLYDEQDYLYDFEQFRYLKP
jgi:hypothetical protein